MMVSVVFHSFLKNDANSLDSAVRKLKDMIYFIVASSFIVGNFIDFPFFLSLF